MSGKARSVRRARRQRTSRTPGFIITCDVDSEDSALCVRLRRFIFGDSTPKNGKQYRYPGFVEETGVQYVEQSVLFMRGDLLPRIRSFLASSGIQYVVMEATLGPFCPIEWKEASAREAGSPDVSP